MTAGSAGRCPQAEQSVGWALRALEPAEEAEAVAHLPRCAECRTLVAQTEELLAMLGSSEPTVEPPAELRVNLLARIADTPQLRTSRLPTPAAARAMSQALPPQPRPVLEPDQTPQHMNGAKPPEAPEPSEPSEAPDPAEPSDATKGTPTWARRWRTALVAAAVLAAVTIGGLAIRTAQLEEQNGNQVSQTQQLASQLEQLRRPGAKAATLSPAGGTPIAAVVVGDGERKVITVGVPPNGSTNTYVLWGTGLGAPRALGTFDVTPADSGVHAVGSVQQPESYTGYAISLEPGRAAPTSPSLMVASGLVQS